MKAFWLCVGVIGAAALGADAAEIRFRAECRPEGAIVRLSDVAEIIAAEPAEAADLGQIELFAVPPLGEKRFMRAQQIQDQLLLSKINLAHHRLTGASQITVYGLAKEAPEPAPKQQAPRQVVPKSLASSEVRRAGSVVRESILRLLKQQAGAEHTWSVDCQVDEAQARGILSATSTLTAQGGTPPWTGNQKFTVSCNVPSGEAEFTIDAEVTLPPSLVVVVRPIPRGSIVQPTDVELRPGKSSITPGALGSLDEAVGMETTRVLFAGQVLDSQSVQKPLLVHQGEVVTVYARASGVQVRTTGRARDEGSLGSLVEVESLLDRNIIFARVSGVQEVEVYAPPATIGGGTN